MFGQLVNCPRPVFSARKGSRLLTPLLAVFILQLDQGSDARASAYQLPIQTSPQGAATQSSPEVTTLEPGKAVERDLAGGERHVYKITMAEGQYFRVEVKQLSSTVLISLQLPDGKTLQVQDLPEKKEVLTIKRVAESTGIYRLSIYSRPKTPAGRYQIQVAQVRSATEDERALQVARRLYDEYFELNRAGKYVEARPLLMRALEIRERVLGADHLDVAQTLQMIVNSYILTADYASAEPLAQRVLAIKEKRLGPQDPAMAQAFYDYGAFLYYKGDQLKAEEAFLRALSIFEKTNLQESLNVAYALTLLGDIYYGWGDYAKADAYYQRSLSIQERNLGPDHYHLAFLLASLGSVAYDAGDYPKAEAMFRRGLALNEKTFGPGHGQLTASLNDLAKLYGTIGDYATAQAFYRRAQTIYETVGASSETTQNTLFGLARLSAAQGRATEAVELLARAIDIEERLAESNIAVGSEREKLAYLNKLSLRSSRGISLHAELAPYDPVARDLAISTILRRKGRVQDAMSQSIAALRRRSGAEEQKLLDELNDVTSKLANLVLRVPPKTTPAEHQAQIKQLEERREKLEVEIGRRSSGFYHRAPPATLAAVQQAIPERAALIEFAVYRPFDPKKPDNETAYGDPHYVAYVVRGQGEVQWKELGTAKEIDQAIGELRQALPNPTRKDTQQLARTVDDKVMQPVRSLLGDATQLLVSPDGALNLIPFEALVDEHGNYLVQRYSFTYLTSGRDLLRMNVTRASKSKPTVFANPSFGEPNQTAEMRSAPTNGKRRNVTAANSLSQVYFAALGGSAQEARTIQTLFPETTLFTGPSATETAIKEVVAPRILHIATHGFFLQDPGIAARGSAQLGSLDASTRIENPLLRSGLALTGANLRHSGANDDGILTALEASGLNLWGTKLVVLSACDTGLGEVRNDEGVYGLRRAFVLAGAESLVMSLWPVSDYSTRNLMISYYKNLKLGLGRGTALRQVQLDLLKRNSRLHPFYWANFIQSGEWANLNGKR